MVFPCRSVMGAVSQMCIYKFRMAYPDLGKLSVISQLTLILFKSQAGIATSKYYE